MSCSTTFTLRFTAAGKSMVPFSQPIHFPLDSRVFHCQAVGLVLLQLFVLCVVRVLAHASGCMLFFLCLVFLVQRYGKILSIHCILQIKLCSPPGTLPSHPHVNVLQFKTKMWTEWNAKPATLHYQGDLQGHFGCEPSLLLSRSAFFVSLT